MIIFVINIYQKLNCNINHNSLFYNVPVSLFQLRWLERDHLVAPQLEESDRLIDPADDSWGGRNPTAVVSVPE